MPNSVRESLIPSSEKARSAQKQDRCRRSRWPRVFTKKYAIAFCFCGITAIAFIPQSKIFVAKNLAFPKSCDKAGLLRVYERDRRLRSLTKNTHYATTTTFPINADFMADTKTPEIQPLQIPNIRMGYFLKRRYYRVPLSKKA